MASVKKAKDKVKAKVAGIKTKVAKAKAKVKSKCKGCKDKACAAIALLLCASATILAGCLGGTESVQPAKSMNQNNDFRYCNIIVASKCTISNKVIQAEGTDDSPGVDIFTQVQSLESSGTETYSPAATQTPSLDVKPDIDVRYNDALAAASTASKGVLESLTSASANMVLELMASKKAGTVKVTRKDGTKATVQCADGQCSICEDGQCSDPE